MHSKGRFLNVIFGASLRQEGTTFAIMIMLLFLVFVPLFLTLTAQPAQAQTYKVVYNFTGRADGDGPNGLTIDRAGNLYGTTNLGGSNNFGTVFKLTRHGSRLDSEPTL